MPQEIANAGFYTDDASLYDEQRWTSSGGAFTNEKQQRILSSLCRDWTGGSVVEIGPGTGRFTIPLTGQGNAMTLVDIAPGMLEQVRKNIEAAGVQGSISDYVEGSIYGLPFESNTFEHAISLNVFNHLEHPDKALSEMARVIRPGQTLLFNYANVRSYYWPMARRINARSQAIGQEVFSAWEHPSKMKRIIADAGLELVQRLGHVHVPRAMERRHMLPLVRVLDSISRSGPLAGLAPVQFCLCRKKPGS
jgi:ubiquinone/menaquinone biosynthesis C-methylase UbiE